MDAAVHDEALHRDARDLAPDGVKGADDHRFGSVVNDQVHTGGGLQGADVAALAADDAALHVVVGQVDHADGAFGHMVGGAFLNRQGDDVTGFLLALLAGARLDLAHHGGSVVVGVLLNAADQHLAGLILRHAGDALHLGHLPLLVVFNFLPHLLQFVLLFAQRLLAGFQGVLLFIQRFLTLQDAALAALHLGAALAAFPVQLGFQAQNLLLGLEDGFLFLFIGLALCVFQQVFCVFLGAANLLFAGLLAVQISARCAQRRRRNRYDDRYDPVHGVHSLPLILLPAGCFLFMHGTAFCF